MKERGIREIFQLWGRMTFGPSKRHEATRYVTRGGGWKKHGNRISSHPLATPTVAGTGVVPSFRRRSFVPNFVLLTPSLIKSLPNIGLLLFTFSPLVFSSWPSRAESTIFLPDGYFCARLFLNLINNNNNRKNLPSSWNSNYQIRSHFSWSKLEELTARTWCIGQIESDRNLSKSKWERRRGKKQKCGAVVTDTGWMAVERCRYSPRQYLGYTAVRYPELSGNVARSDAAVRQLDDPLPHYIR